jgi:hypothetical protein
MTTLESLICLVGTISRQERKPVRNYLCAQPNGNKRPNKLLKLFELLIANPSKQWTIADLEMRLDLQRFHGTFGGLVAQLRRRLLEALSLPLTVAGNENYSERTKAEIHFHRQYLKALILFEAGDYASADEILLALIFWTEKYELFAERMAAAEFLMRTIRVYGNADALKHFKDIPDESRLLLSAISQAETIREMLDEGTYAEAQLKITAFNQEIKDRASRRALFVMKGVEAKAAVLGGKYGKAQKAFIEQLGCCNHESVWSEEDRAQVYTDIAQSAVYMQKKTVAKEYIEMALRCRRKFKKTLAELEKLQVITENEVDHSQP